MLKNFQHVSGVYRTRDVSLTLRIRRVACTCVPAEAAKVNENVEWTQTRADTSSRRHTQKKNTETENRK